MSYILDALRKSDQQRRLGGVPTLPVAPAVALTPERSRMFFYGPSAPILLIAAVAAIAWLRPWLPEPAAVAVIVAKPLESPAGQPAPVVLSHVPAQGELEPSRHARSSAALAIPSPMPPAPRRKLSASAKGETHNAIPMAAATSASGIASDTPEATAGKNLAVKASQTKPLTSSDLPSSIRQQLPHMSVAVHAYSSNPLDRLVSINGRMLREGDSLTPDLKLEQITPDGMVFAYRGYRFRRSAQ